MNLPNLITIYDLVALFFTGKTKSSITVCYFFCIMLYLTECKDKIISIWVCKKHFYINTVIENLARVDYEPHLLSVSYSGSSFFS